MSSKRKLMQVDYRDIENDTVKNTKYRKVVYTVPDRMQLVLMSLKPGETIPKETHTGAQFVRVESGQGRCVANGKEYLLKDGISLTIPDGTPHFFENTAKRRYLKLYTIYTPPEHKANAEQQRQ